jgi:hypothetical protein
MNGKLPAYLNAIWFSAAFRQISFGYRSSEAAGRQKFSLAEPKASLLDVLDKVNVPERLVYVPFIGAGFAWI